MTHKIEPLRDSFENMQALLARIAEDPDAVGFAGVVFRKPDSAVTISFNCSRAEVTFAAAMLQADALDSSA